ncbi:MAG: hypothetical protein ABJB34_00505 [Acidobacteriota bacterium]
MMGFQFKQIILALSLMASLVIGHASAACTCSHDEPATIDDADCHSHHTASHEFDLPDADASALDNECTCVAQPTPYGPANSVNKEFKSKDLAAAAVRRGADAEFVTTSILTAPAPELANNLSYSNTLRSLLPSRAPPRL